MHEQGADVTLGRSLDPTRAVAAHPRHLRADRLTG
jgi:hypothetical protein